MAYFSFRRFGKSFLFKGMMSGGAGGSGEVVDLGVHVRTYEGGE